MDYSALDADAKKLKEHFKNVAWIKSGAHPYACRQTVANSHKHRARDIDRAVENAKHYKLDVSNPRRYLLNALGMKSLTETCLYGYDEVGNRPRILRLARNKNVFGQAMGSAYNILQSEPPSKEYLRYNPPPPMLPELRKPTEEEKQRAFVYLHHLQQILGQQKHLYLVK